MHLPVLISLFGSYFGTQIPSQTVFVYDCMNTSGEHLKRSQSECVAPYIFFRFIADNVKFTMESSLLGVRLSIIQLNDRHNGPNIVQIIRTMTSSTHNICPVGILFNYDCPLSKSFISAVSKNQCVQFGMFERVYIVSVLIGRMLWRAFQVVDFRGKHRLSGNPTASRDFALHRRRNRVHQFRRCHWVCR